ncbi:MAG: helix-turn-helix transcriptional regulator [Actinomycetes bacterium]
MAEMVNQTETTTAGDTPLRRLRKQAGLTQQELADRAQVSRSWVAQAEAGQIPKPRPLTIRSLADVLMVDIETMGRILTTPPPDRECAFHIGRAELLRLLAANHAGAKNTLITAVRQQQLLAFNRVAEFSWGRTEDGVPRELQTVCKQMNRGTRLLLLVELSMVDPFAPYSVEITSSRRAKAMTSLASDLGLTGADEAVRDELAVMNKAKALKKLRQDGEDRAELDLGPALVGFSGAGLQILPPVLRGCDLVGWFGWGAAGGLFLADAYQRAQNPGVGSLLARVMPTDGPTLTAMLNPLVSVTDATNANQQGAGNNGNAVRAYFDDLAEVLDLLGPRYTAHTLRRLILTYRVLLRDDIVDDYAERAVASGRPKTAVSESGMPQLSDALISFDSAPKAGTTAVPGSDSDDDITRAITRRMERLKQYCDPGSAPLTRLEGIAEMLEETYRHLNELSHAGVTHAPHTTKAKVIPKLLNQSP